MMRAPFIDWEMNGFSSSQARSRYSPSAWVLGKSLPMDGAVFSKPVPTGECEAGPQRAESLTSRVPLFESFAGSTHASLCFAVSKSRVEYARWNRERAVGLRRSRAHRLVRSCCRRKTRASRRIGVASQSSWNSASRAPRSCLLQEAPPSCVSVAARLRCHTAPPAALLEIWAIYLNAS